jgi:mono/diheme cytochrome c family protein
MKKATQVFIGKNSFLGWALFLFFVITGCADKRHPGKVYMPDMAYSRSYEAYAPNDLKNKGINYIASPVTGTIRRGDLFPYTLPNDSNGYKMSAGVQDPLPPLDSTGLKEAQRLYNINCAICHGANLDAQGPMATSGKVGGIANLKLDQYKAMSKGTMFHVVTYGKGNMGSYMSQLDKKQRWMVVQYVKSQQVGQGTTSTADSAAVAPSGGTTPDSAAVAATGSTATK